MAKLKSSLRIGNAGRDGKPLFFMSRKAEKQFAMRERRRKEREAMQPCIVPDEYYEPSTSAIVGRNKLRKHGAAHGKRSGVTKDYDPQPVERRNYEFKGFDLTYQRIAESKAKAKAAQAYKPKSKEMRRRLKGE